MNGHEKPLVLVVPLTSGAIRILFGLGWLLATGCSLHWMYEGLRSLLAGGLIPDLRFFLGMVPLLWAPHLHRLWKYLSHGTSLHATKTELTVQSAGTASVVLRADTFRGFEVRSSATDNRYGRRSAARRQPTESLLANLSNGDVLLAETRVGWTPGKLLAARDALREFYAENLSPV